MDDTLIASMDAGFGFEMHETEDGVIIYQDDVEVHLSYEEAYAAFEALAEIFAEGEEEEADYYDFDEEEV
jgi:hypothetical protein